MGSRTFPGAETGALKFAGDRDARDAEIPGRPLVYETTEFFLDHFGLRNLDELPNVEELRTRHLPVSPRSQGPTEGIVQAGPSTPAAT